MNRQFLPTIVIYLGVLFGCASITDWTPTVDPHNDPNAVNIEKDLAECKTLANKVTGGGVEEGAKYGSIGAGLGAAVGAVLGSIYYGDAGSGAAIGATTAGGAGAAAGGLHGEMTYKQAYINCVAMRGHRVIDP